MSMRRRRRKPITTRYKKVKPVKKVKAPTARVKKKATNRGYKIPKTPKVSGIGWGP